jgi:hypothetical protein
MRSRGRCLRPARPLWPAQYRTMHRTWMAWTRNFVCHETTSIRSLLSVCAAVRCACLHRFPMRAFDSIALRRLASATVNPVHPSSCRSSLSSASHRSSSVSVMSRDSYMRHSSTSVTSHNFRRKRVSRQANIAVAECRLVHLAVADMILCLCVLFR